MPEKTKISQQYRLSRRGFNLGRASETCPNDGSIIDAWQQGSPILLKEVCANLLEDFQGNIQESFQLYEIALSGEFSCDEMLAQEPYRSRLEPMFESLGSSMNEGDDQEIETVLFDANDQGEVVAEDLWMKASWLSFHEEDASLRFRFSFGVDLHEDVAADQHRQHYASLLTDAVFPESRVITDNQHLQATLLQVLGSDNVNFVERIVYFNSPNGGAYLHHDRERGHAGVVYAQVTGETFWLALPKQQLMQELGAFITQCQLNQRWPDSVTTNMQEELVALVRDSQALSEQLESFSNATLIHVMNETQAFVQHLMSQGHGRHLQAGDVLLLPQETDASCCWHSVFCLGEETGQALSFAIRSGE